MKIKHDGKSCINKIPFTYFINGYLYKLGDITNTIASHGEFYKNHKLFNSFDKILKQTSTLTILLKDRERLRDPNL